MIGRAHHMLRVQQNTVIVKKVAMIAASCLVYITAKTFSISNTGTK
jgi:hypothetical protein